MQALPRIATLLTMAAKSHSRLKARAFTALYWFYSRLWRMRYENFPVELARRGACLFGHWHGDELLLLGGFRPRPMAILSSLSRDGELMTWIATWLGFTVVRGSSSRGGAAGLKGLIDEVNTGSHASLAVDGPRGPLYKVKPGLFKLAEQTGRPVILGACAASRKISFRNAWNRCYLPLPFARCAIQFGDPIWVDRPLSEATLQELCTKAEVELSSLKAKAEAIVASEKRALQFNPAGV